MRRTGLYRVDGVRVPSVTEILYICGLTDMSGIPDDVLEAARLRGEEVHSWCEMLDKGDVTPNDAPDSSIAGYVEAYIRFKVEAGFEVIHNEHPFVNERDRYAGMIDRVAYRRNLKQSARRFVTDLKCVALVSAATCHQVTGYAHGMDVCGGWPPGAHGRESLQLRRDGTYRLKQYCRRDDYHDWAACVRLAHWKLNNNLATLED